MKYINWQNQKLFHQGGGAAVFHWRETETRLILFSGESLSTLCFSNYKVLSKILAEIHKSSFKRPAAAKHSQIF